MESAAVREYDVIVIGGGITGAGTARDCAMRGLKTLLVERGNIATGATGRNHGLMHSGARYAVTDPASARECIEENMVLRDIASHCIDDTDGLFVTTPYDDIGYQATFVEACKRVGIDAYVISPELALQQEPALNPNILGAVCVPDAAIDPFRLTAANVASAIDHGVSVLTQHEVTGFVMRGASVEGVRLLDRRTGQCCEARAGVTINAAGIWGCKLMAKTGVDLPMIPSKGAMLVMGKRLCNMVVNRCRRPANADILVPDDTVSIIGTTSDRIQLDAIDDMRVTASEVATLINEGQKLVPSLASTPVLRAYAGVRPLIAAQHGESERGVSRGIVCVDHAERDGVDGLVTITGGKLITYRLMAQEATDAACRKLGVNQPCRTREEKLPGTASSGTAGSSMQIFSMPYKAARHRHGNLASRINTSSSQAAAMVCECQQVPVGEIDYAMSELGAGDLATLRLRTRLGMGNCQGKLCAVRAAAMLCAHKGGKAGNALRDLDKFLSERWRGIKPVAWGQALAGAQATAAIYGDLCGLDEAIKQIGEDER